MPVGIFYYPWYSSNPASSPENWNSQYTSVLGKYDGGSTAVIQQHIRWLDYSGVDFAIASWWGPGTKEDIRFPLLLENTVALNSGLKWCPYYEDEGFSDPSSATIRADLDHILAQGYTTHPNFLHHNGKPVIFVYGDALDADAMATRWAPMDDFYVVLKVFTGYATTADQPDAWHQYGPATARSQHPPYSNNVSPGFWFWSAASPQLARDPDRFRADLEAMKAANVEWKLITSFNEYGEGTVIEPSTGTDVGTSLWPTETTYLDIVHDVFSTSAVVCHMGDGITGAAESRCRAIAVAIPECDVFVYGGDVYNAGNTAEFVNFDECYGDLATTVSPPGQNLISKMAHTFGNHEYGSGNPTTFQITNGGDAYYLGGTPSRVSRSHVVVDTAHTDTAAAYPASGLSSADAQKVAVAQWSHLNYLDLNGWRLLFLDTARYSSNDGAFPTTGAYRSAVQALVNGAAHRRLIVFGHHPKWTSSLSHREPRPEMTPLWDLISPRALLYVSGHDHVYERQNARLPDGSVASTQTQGCAQIICGTAGVGLNSFAASYSPQAAIGFQSSTVFGFIKLILNPNTVDLEFYSLGTNGLEAATLADSATFVAVDETTTTTINLSEADSTRLGSVPADEVWLGSTLVWEATVAPPVAGPALVKQTNGSVDVATTAPTLSVTSTAGNTLIAMLASGGGATSSVSNVSDTAGNVWLEHEDIGVTGLTNSHMSMWYALNAASPGTITVTGSNQTWQWQVVEFSDVATVGQPDDAPNGTANATTTTTAVTPAATATQSGSLVIGMIAHGSTPTATLASPGWTSFTDPPASGNKHLRSAWTLAATPGSYQASWTLSSAVAHSATSLALKPAGQASGIGPSSSIGPNTLIGP